MGLLGKSVLPPGSPGDSDAIAGLSKNKKALGSVREPRAILFKKLRCEEALANLLVFAVTGFAIGGLRQHIAGSRFTFDSRLSRFHQSPG